MEVKIAMLEQRVEVLEQQIRIMAKALDLKVYQCERCHRWQAGEPAVPFNYCLDDDDTPTPLCEKCREVLLGQAEKRLRVLSGKDKDGS